MNKKITQEKYEYTRNVVTLTEQEVIDTIIEYVNSEPYMDLENEDCEFDESDIEEFLEDNDITIESEKYKKELITKILNEINETRSNEREILKKEQLSRLRDREHIIYLLEYWTSEMKELDEDYDITLSSLTPEEILDEIIKNGNKKEEQ